MWPQRKGSSNCLAKTQVYAKPKGEDRWADACPVLEGYEERLDASRSFESKPQ